MKIAYDGTNYHGWQIQPNAITVQEIINDILNKITGNQPVTTAGCGRTDTGVHASQYFLHFDLDHELDLNSIYSKIVKMLPNDIKLFELKKVSEDVHARFSAKSRRYHYYIANESNPFKRLYQLSIVGTLNMDAMNKACQYLLGEHDFSCFCKTNTSTSTNVCLVMDAKWYEEDDQLVFTIQANRFLRNMVRAIVGTMLEVGEGKIEPEEMKKILDSKSRSEAGRSVPGNALFLSEINY